MRVNESLGLELLVIEHLVGGTEISLHKVLLRRAVTEEKVACGTFFQID